MFKPIKLHLIKDDILELTNEQIEKLKNWWINDYSSLFLEQTRLSERDGSLLYCPKTKKVYSFNRFTEIMDVNYREKVYSSIPLLNAAELIQFLTEHYAYDALNQIYKKAMENYNKTLCEDLWNEVKKIL